MKLVSKLMFIFIVFSILISCSNTRNTTNAINSMLPLVTISPTPETTTHELKFHTERLSNGDLIATPLGYMENDYMLTIGSIATLNQKWFHTVNMSYGNQNSITALVVQDPITDEVHVEWSETMSGSSNIWQRAFMNSYHMLIPYNDNQLLFLESELTETDGQFHLSSYDVNTREINRLRENFWPLADDYDYLYKYEWNASKQTLFMQSYLGHVWFFDLMSGEDVIHHLSYRVIPHSTSGYPSLFLSPTFERFVHDDESGKLTFFDQQGVALNTIQLPIERFVPSEKIKWNPKGTIAWMDQAGVGKDRILAVDIDYLKVGPEQINFYNPNGIPIGAIQAENISEGEAIEVVAWIDANVAVIKCYTVNSINTDNDNLVQTDIYYYLYDVISDTRGSITDSIPSGAIIVEDIPWYIDEQDSPIIATYKDITYRIH